MEKGKTNWLFKLIVAFAFVAMVTVNALANILPINGITTGAVSDSYPNLFTPAGYTFAIWGLIYLLLAFYTLYLLGLFRGGEKAEDLYLRRIGFMFAMTSLVNIAWIFSWHYDRIALSMILILFLLIYLIDIAFIIKTKGLSAREKWLVRLPFSIYFGWITVAAIANVTVFLVSIGWDGFGLSESTWTIIMLAVGALIGILTALRFNDIAYMLVFIWAYIGILVKHLSPAGFDGQYRGVIMMLIVCLVLFVATIVYILLNRRKKTT